MLLAVSRWVLPSFAIRIRSTVARMHNKVVHTLAKSLAENKYTAVRFNFRGVGDSAGIYDEGIGEADDAMAVADWAMQQQADMPVILAGFSFGSFVALQAASKDSRPGH